MAITTVFLTVLIVALAIGNVLLFFVSPRREEETEAIAEAEVKDVEDSSDSSSSSTVPLAKKIDLAHKRIQALEDAVNKPESRVVSPSFKRKVEKLDNFRSTVEAELIGIKDILAELQNKGVTVKSRSFNAPAREKKKKLNHKSLHSLVYRSAKKK